MRRLCSFVVAAGLLAVSLSVCLNGQGKNVKALVGGTLIDGFGAPPIRNSVVLIEGERISAVGQVGTLRSPPAPRSSPPKA